MKININELKEIPKQLGSGFCVYGIPSVEVQAWIDYHKFTTLQSGPFTNISIPHDYSLSDCFIEPAIYDWVDGFSPNLNKWLHLGHISNFVLAKSFQKLGIGKKYLANLGDTLEGKVSKHEALPVYLDICKQFDYHIDKLFFASELNGVDNLLIPGENEYKGTQIFHLSNNKNIVGKKSNGSTSYFYQDVALATILNSKTLYLTGFEQSGHFQDLKTLFLNIEHLPLGLVTVKGKKMASREGNVIYLSEVIDLFKEKFGDNPALIWNVLAGYILKSVPGSTKNIDLDQLDNVKLSSGLYLSYTLAKLKSASLQFNEVEEFNSFTLKVKLWKAKCNLQPHILLDGIIDVAKQISALYEQYKIKDCPENHKHFIPLAQDLLHGMKLLGMFDIEKV